jgi:hypothetical protein
MRIGAVAAIGVVFSKDWKPRQRVAALETWC